MIGGEDISSMEDRRLTLYRRDRVGIIFQFFNLLPILNLEENIVLPYLLREGSNPSAEKIEQLLHQMNLYERRYHHPHELSGGEMQRVAICRALIWLMSQRVILTRPQESRCSRFFDEFGKNMERPSFWSLTVRKEQPWLIEL
jgi:ABC-type lipoprotein export system ATPase subunit